MYTCTCLDDDSICQCFTCKRSEEAVAAVDFPAQRYAISPALWIQPYKPRGYWPIKLIHHHCLQVACVFVAREELRTTVSATDGCVVVIGGAGDLDVIAGDAIG